MTIVTIPKTLARKGDLVVLPRGEYELLIQRQPRAVPLVRLTAAEKRAIAQSEKEFARGEYVTLEELEHELGGTRIKKSS